MREMKDSGLIWLGKIPAEWELTRIGGLYSLRNEKVSDKDYPPLSVTNKGILPQLKTVAKTNDGDNRKLVKIGDFAINSRSDRRGSCGISPYDGSVSLINTVLTPRTEMEPQYFDWLFHSVQFGDENYRWGHGIVNDLWTTGWQEMKKISIPMPSITDQRCIANFLNAKCGEIDDLITNVQLQIDVLEQYKRTIITKTVTKGLNPNDEMKESGIEWVGTMPVRWISMPNKYMMNKVKNLCSVYAGEDILSLTMNGVIIRDLDAGGKMPTTFNGYQRVSPGNLLMCLFDIDVTPRCIGLIKNEGVTSPAYSQFKLGKDGHAQYYYYYYLMLDYTKELLHLAKNLRHSLTEDQLGAISIPVPPLFEQKEIASFLDEKCNRIEVVISEKQQQLICLNEYKKSLIYEYVTGKKEVTL